MRSLPIVLAVLFVMAIVSQGCDKKEAPKGGLKTLLGEKLIDRSKSTVEVSSLGDKKVGIYFSAHWCPPCRAFTPHLVSVYNELKKQGKKFEIVFVSSDRDEKHMLSYMSEMKMPWLAIPFGDERVKKLKSRFGVRGIPSLVIVSPEGATLSKDGRNQVAQKGAAAYSGW